MNLREVELEMNPKVRRIKKRLIQSESRLMMKCDSPNIIKCHQSFENADLKIMIIDFCNSGNLQEEIDKRDQIPEADAIAILKQIIMGIAECHRNKIIHRDLKA